MRSLPRSKWLRFGIVCILCVGLVLGLVKLLQLTSFTPNTSAP